MSQFLPFSLSFLLFSYDSNTKDKGGRNLNCMNNILFTPLLVHNVQADSSIKWLLSNTWYYLLYPYALSPWIQKISSLSSWRFPFPTAPDYYKDISRKMSQGANILFWPNRPTYLLNRIVSFSFSLSRMSKDWDMDDGRWYHCLVRLTGRAFIEKPFFLWFCWFSIVLWSLWCRGGRSPERWYCLEVVQDSWEICLDSLPPTYLPPYHLLSVGGSVSGQLLEKGQLRFLKSESHFIIKRKMLTFFILFQSLRIAQTFT